MKISATDLSYFSDCRRSWYLGRSWAPKRPDSKYWLGTAVHAGLEAYYKSKRDYEKMIKGFWGFVEPSLSKIERDYPFLWGSIQPEFENLTSLGEGMLTNYWFWDQENPIEGAPIAIERRVGLPISNEITLTGKMDLVMKTPRGLMVVDHKTSGEAFSLAGLDVDEQLTAYSYLVWKLYGEIPKVVMYNMLIKKLPADPVVLKSGGLSKAKDQTTVYALYKAKLEELGLDLGEYEEILGILQGAGWSKFFIREGSSRNETELQAFERRVIQKGTDIINIVTHPGEYAYPSPSAYRCGYCPFLGACKAMDDGGDHQSILESAFTPNTRY